MALNDSQNLNLKISVGILLYKNSLREIYDCLDFLASQSVSHVIVEVLIRDQSGGCLEHVEAWIAGGGKLPVKTSVGANLGFGAGHNMLFKQMNLQSDAYLCLNPDGVMHPLALEEMIVMAERNQWAGIFEAIQEPVMHPKYFDPISGLTAWCSAACVLYPSKIFREVGGFDDDFFMYCEDVDLSWRIKAAGFQCYTAANAFFYHYAIDRGNRALDIWRSAYLLAHKWRALNFKSNARNTLLSLVDVEPEGIIEYIETHAQHSVETVLGAAPDFNNGLYFSRPMWIS